MRPIIGIFGLVLAAILLVAVLSKVHPYNGSPPMADQDAQQAQAEADKKAAAKPNTPASPTAIADGSKAFDAVKEGAIKATLVVEGRGTIVMELYPKAAPKTVAHFVDLCKKHFYDGVKFHRVEPGFVVQGGDPDSKNMDAAQFKDKQIGTHGSGTTVPLEVNLPHLKNTIGLARSNAEDSGDSQFYFNLNTNTPLDGKYCVFGKIVSGEDVPEKIQIGDKITSLTIP